MAEVRQLLGGLSFGESLRWHQDRLWFCNWGTQEVIALGLDGAAEVVARIPTTLPYSIDWLPDGRLLAVSARDCALLRQEPDGSLAPPKMKPPHCSELDVGIEPVLKLRAALRD